MRLSNFTQNLLDQHFLVDEEIADDWMIRMFGGVMMVTSLIGILVNSKVLLGYINQNMSSFYIMCSSKTVSNLIIISGYLFYNAPISIMNSFEGPTFLNKVVNQMVTYGVYLMGPVTQYLISLNRLLVFYFVKQSTTQNNQKVTLAVLAIFWCISIAVIVQGTRDDCNLIFIPELLNWWSGGCDDVIADIVVTFVFCCAVLSNVCNFLVVIKLIKSILQNSGRLDSESTSRRKRRSRKLFIQNCFQDWIFVIDMINAFFVHKLFNNIGLQFVFSVYSNLLVYVLDGCIMLFFNYESKKPVKLPVLKVKNKGDKDSGGGTGNRSSNK